MSRKNDALRRDPAKDALDERTPYTTFLPHMDEGFHVGYQPNAGVQNDRNQRPREWLENLARFMRTQGTDVGYAIPDVLASEQQLRRLSRLPRELAMRHQEMIDYRATLALLLLWDFWPHDETWPTLALVRADGENSPFSASVLSALAPMRASQGLRLFTLSRAGGNAADERPLCLLSQAMILSPAADPGDLGDLLPARVRWYDRARKRFTDPCGCLDESEIALLTARLRLLEALNERPELQSPLYSPEAELCSLLERFSNDLTLKRTQWRERLQGGDEGAQRDLRARLLTVWGLDDGASEQRVHTLNIKADNDTLRGNPLIKQYLPNNVEPPEDIADAGLTLYLLGDTPIARLSDFCTLEPSGFAGEDDALRAAKRELDLLSRFRDGWNARMAQKFWELAARSRERVGYCPRAVELCEEWAEALSDAPMSGERGVTLTYPMQSYPETLKTLLGGMLGDMDEGCIRAPFSDCLLLVADAQRPPLSQAALSRACLVEEAEGAPARYAVPPLSPELCAWLQAQSERDDPAAPTLKAGGFRFALDTGTNEITASFRVTARTREGESVTVNTVVFKRAYRLCDRLETGAAYAADASALPYVAVWPNARLATGLWKQYYVYAHRPDAVDVWVLGANGWAQGETRRAIDEGGRRQSRERAWQTAQTERFPAYVALKRGTLSLGALVNDRPRQQLKLEPPAVIGMDFGSIATTLMLRQGDKVQPAALPRCLHQPLLCANEDDERYLTDELLPATALLPDARGNGSSYYSVMDMFTDDAARWTRPLVDGHIYYRESLSGLLRKSENTLYYDMKWGEDDYVLRCIRLFLRQAMTQAALSARLWGSPSVSWRVSMPNALPAHRQEAYLELVRGLAREVAQASGLPLTANCPAVLYASENQADGLYFRGRNEVNARSGYVNLDIGGGTTDLSLWLGGAAHATAECSLRLGCRQMLFDSISMWHVTDFEQDFLDAAAGAKAASQEIARAMRDEGATTRGRQKTMFLLDDFFAEYSLDIRAAMAGKRAEGRISYVECLLLFNIGFLFCVAGELLERAYADETLRAILPARMELCIAGNGGQLLKAFTDEQREKLCRLALGMLSNEHPLRGLLPVQSRNPKQEVAIGLLSGEELQSSVIMRDRWNGTSDVSGETKEDLLTRYLPMFAAHFPQAAQRLMPKALEGARLTEDAVIELDTVFANERQKTPDDDMTTYTRCLAGIKRLWRI